MGFYEIRGTFLGARYNKGNSAIRGPFSGSPIFVNPHLGVGSGVRLWSLEGLCLGHSGCEGPKPRIRSAGKLQEMPVSKSFYHAKSARFSVRFGAMEPEVVVIDYPETPKPLN